MVDDVVLVDCSRRIWPTRIGEIGVGFGCRELVITLRVIWYSDSISLSVFIFYQVTILERKHRCSQDLVGWSFRVIR